MFQYIISGVLGGLEGALKKSDDNSVFGSSEKEHDQRLESVLSRLEQSGLTANL